MGLVVVLLLLPRTNRQALGSPPPSPLQISAYERMSKLAAAACHLTLQALRPSHAPLWTKALEYFSGGYRDSDPSFRTLIQHLRSLHWNIDGAQYRNILRKVIPPPCLIPIYYLCLIFI